ncbi:LysR family transcriptional regulator [Sphingomonas histidinilytica]|uniref:LysR family transcriptional regulator n=1 Tax=Rhizorhabdus histidinilytica TaxID=439228 RepID=UPI001ADCB625|nr:LysR substrate-binding domain-containing protein [Rhizorhabdus histidinilytica]MBO9379753.1 LysR family transcriptional regulator [Rhizorhabdus histidinilytica]
MLDPAWLRSFVTVARTLSFTQAAALLGTRQSTVSEHVRKLEAVSGVRLFVRDTHMVALTSDGEAMIGFATSILDTQDRALRHFARGDLEGRIRLGVSEDIVLAGLPLLLRRFTAEHPKVVLELTVGLSEILRDRFAQGELDFAFLKRRGGGGAGEGVWRDPLVWMAAPDFRLDRDQPLPLIVLAPPAITRMSALEALERAGRPWRLMCTSESQSGIHAAVAAGLGVAPHARSLLPEGLVELRDDRLPPLDEVEFVILVGQPARRDPARALVEMIKTNGSLLRRRRNPAAAATA